MSYIKDLFLKKISKLRKKRCFYLCCISLLLLIAIEISTNYIGKAYSSKINITLKATSTTDSTVSLKWSKTSMTGYYVYSYNQNSNTYKRITSTTKTSYTVKKLTSSKKYFFAVRAYKYNKKTKKYTYSNYSNIITVITRPKKVSNIRVEESSNDNLNIKYDNQKNISNFEIYSYDNSNDTFKLISSTSDTKLKLPKTTANYYIKAATNFDNKNYYSEQSGKIASNAFPNKATNCKVTTVKTNYADIIWNTAKKAKRYNLYRYNVSTKENKYLGTTIFRKIKVKSLKANTSYHLRVRGVNKVDGITYYGPLTDIKFTTKASSAKATKNASASSDTNFNNDIDIEENPSYVLNKSLNKPTIKITRTKLKQIKLTWNKVSNIDGYLVYKYDSNDQKYKLLKKTSLTYCYDDKINSMQTLNYKVRSYKNTADCIYISEFSNTANLFTGSFGIDVSRWQGSINWQKVKAAGVDYAIIATTKRSSTSSDAYLIKDQYFDTNIKGAIANGIKVGVYSYSIADSVAEAKKEADLVLSIIKGYKITYPVAFDYEKKESIQKRTKAQNASIVSAFCDKVKSAGYKPCLYSGAWILSNLIDYSKISKYDLWVANYIRDSSNNVRQYTFPNDITKIQNDLPKKCNSGSYTTIKDSDILMWQFSECGKVAGISDNKVDLNFRYKNP